MVGIWELGILLIVQVSMTWDVEWFQICCSYKVLQKLLTLPFDIQIDCALEISKS